MADYDLKIRTKKFAVKMFFFADKLPKNRAGEIVYRQIIRSSSSVAANYRAVLRAKSNKDFINKLTIVQEEADETLFWLEYILETGLLENNDDMSQISMECNEILSIITKSILTSKSKINQKSNKFEQK